MLPLLKKKLPFLQERVQQCILSIFNFMQISRLSFLLNPAV